MEQDKRYEREGDAGLRHLMRSVIEEFLASGRGHGAQGQSSELEDERRRRESLERRVNELVEENRRARSVAEESERSAAVRGELQRLGVAKVDVAFRAVKDDIVRGPEGRLVARTASGEQEVREYLSSWVQENPEFLPARIAGGSGATSPQRGAQHGAAVELEKIRPGMSPEELQRVREQIQQVALQSMRGE